MKPKNPRHHQNHRFKKRRPRKEAFPSIASDPGMRQGSLVRLQKYLAECGVAARRKAERLIEKGLVSVNGTVVTELGTRIDPSRDEVAVKGTLLRPVEKGVLLLHKPKGVVSTMSDPHGRPTVGEYLTAKYRSYFPVGRLDFESSGLMIFTNDGELAQALLHPRYSVERVYEVEVEGGMPQSSMERLNRGVELDDGPARAKVELLEGHQNFTWLRVSITLGRNRIVRRMMDKVGYPVRTLVRVSHGPFQLGRLRPGEMKRVPERQYEQMKRRVFERLDRALSRADERRRERFA